MTMQTSAINTGSSVTSTQKTTTRSFNDMGSEDFFKLLITELQSQDPMKPTDNQQLMQELSTIRSMEQSSTLNKTLQSLASEQRFGSTAGLIGHYVAGTVKDNSGNNYEIQGLVIGVRFDDGGNAILELHNGKSLPAASVQQVTVVENLPADVLAQLEQELGRDLTPDDGGDATDTSDSSSGKSIVAGKTAAKSSVPVATSSAGDSARAAAQKVDGAMSYLDALIAA
jgi:flagellar basal-body rod modification protein FlgD